ncbi:transporter substrate-binding domain-containing protein [Ottowia sp.]|uniref:transporter substrate-binding domain-containing protein n=1 Tax=Ottowia sp. TaxID=1898956 RepID=UPI003A8AACAA
MRALLHPVFLLLLVLGLAPKIAWTQSTAEQARHRGVIHVAYRTDAPPFSMAGKARQPVGYAIDFCQPLIKKLAAAAGNPAMRVRYIPVPVDDVPRLFGGNSVDLLCSGTSDTTARRQSMAFSPPIFLAETRILVPAQSKAESATDLAGKALVVIDRTTAKDAAIRYAADNDIRWKVASAISADAALGQLDLGWAAGYLRDDVLLAAQLITGKRTKTYRMLPEALSTEKIAIAFDPHDPALSAMADEAVREFIQSGQAQATYERWFMQPLQPDGLALDLPMSPQVRKLLTTRFE